MTARIRLTLGATLGLAGCGGGVTSTPADAAPAAAAMQLDASSEVSPSALLDDAATDARYLIKPGDGPSGEDASIISCSSKSGYFACGSNVCNRAIQACFSGSVCAAYSYVAPSCGACPTCACLRDTTLLNIESCTEDTAGSVTVSLYPIGGPGTPCRQDVDCKRGSCVNGACECQPAGAVAPQRNSADDCCSGEASVTTSLDGGLGPFICFAERGSACAPRGLDCYGGPCEGGVCTCIGRGGPCRSPTDCCDRRCGQGPTGGTCGVGWVGVPAVAGTPLHRVSDGQSRQSL